MAKPVQRLPRYILFVKDLLKETVPGHPDLMALQICLKTLENFTENLNNSLKVHGNENQVFELKLLPIFI
jgi:hypothetical protein